MSVSKLEELCETLKGVGFQYKTREQVSDLLYACGELAKYVEHSPSCDRRNFRISVGNECTCGLEAAQNKVTAILERS